MGQTKDKIYAALVKGATDGLRGDALYDGVAAKVAKTDNGRVVRASMLALSDPTLTDRNVLNVIYALAIERRLLDLGVMPSRPKQRRKRENAAKETAAIQAILSSHS